jgi:hypothetical protein
LINDEKEKVLYEEAPAKWQRLQMKERMKRIR